MQRRGIRDLQANLHSEGLFPVPLKNIGVLRRYPR